MDKIAIRDIAADAVEEFKKDFAENFDNDLVKKMFSDRSTGSFDERYLYGNIYSRLNRVFREEYDITEEELGHILYSPESELYEAYSGLLSEVSTIAESMCYECLK